MTQPIRMPRAIINGNTTNMDAMRITNSTTYLNVKVYEY